jgi:hypothetical protein
MRQSGLADVREQAKLFVRDFKKLTGTEQRNLAERLIKKIVVKKGNELELCLRGELPSRGVTRGKKSTEVAQDGGVSAPLSELLFSPEKLQDNLEFMLIPPYRNPIMLHQKYVGEGLSLAQIAEEFFSSKEAVREGLIRAGIAVREPHLPHNGRQSQARFGERRVKGKTVELKTEQRVIDAIQEMRANGLGFRPIARCLTQMQIPTKCRGQRWHPEMVRRIVEI